MRPRGDNGMKKTSKIVSLIVVSASCLAALVVLFTVLFSNAGDTMYIVSMTGDVQVGTAADLSDRQPAQVGMALTSGSIVMTGDKSSCVLAYKSDISNKDNCLNINKNSQVHLYKTNKDSGFDVVLANGSVICNMSENTNIDTTIATNSYNFYAANTIAKVDYDLGTTSGKVFVFDGNPVIQIIQPSGSTGKMETLLKNSVCAVRNLDDGTVGFGCLNTGFGLNEFSAQDLRTMSGIASVWSERVSYNVGDFERAFQTAKDYGDYTTVTAATLAAITEPTVVYTDEIDTIESKDETVEVTTAVTTVSEPIVTTVSTPVSSSAATVASTSVTTSGTTTSVSSRTSVPYTTSKQAEKTTSSSVSTTASNASTKSTTPVTTTTPKTSASSKSTTTAVKVDPDATYTVIFTYTEGDKQFWAMQLVKRGQSAVAPEIPDVEGKYFVQWDRDFSCVTSDMTVTGIFADGVKPATDHTVKFYVDDVLWKTVTVKHGGNVKLADLPMSAGKTFVGWSESVVNVTKDLTVFALFSD